MIDVIPQTYKNKILANQANQTIISNSNAVQIPSGSNGLIFEITNNQGADILVYQLALSFDLVYSKAYIEINNTQQNRRLVSGLTQLGSLGVANENKNTDSFVEIIPFALRSGEFIQVFVNNILGVTIPANNICLSLRGIQ